MAVNGQCMLKDGGMDQSLVAQPSPRVQVLARTPAVTAHVATVATCEPSN